MISRGHMLLKYFILVCTMSDVCKWWNQKNFWLFHDNIDRFQFQVFSHKAQSLSRSHIHLTAIIITRLISLRHSRMHRLHCDVFIHILCGWWQFLQSDYGCYCAAALHSKILDPRPNDTRFTYKNKNRAQAVNVVVGEQNETKVDTQKIK